MTERITQSFTEDAIAGAEDFMQRERGMGIDGGAATVAVEERVASTRDTAIDLLQTKPQKNGFYIPLSKQNFADFDLASTALAGYMVLVPSALVSREDTRSFYPAVISEDGLKQPNTMRLHVLKQGYRQQLNPSVATVLSAAGQSETKGVGEHGHKGGDGVEAEHFATLLAAGSDQQVRQAWQSGIHVNHAWRDKANSSVLTQVNGRIFGKEIPQTTITWTKRDFQEGKAALLWHEGMRDQSTGIAETATKKDALVVIQALGHEAIRTKNPNALDDVKRLIA